MLSRIWIKKLVVLDGDRVDLSNISRQSIFNLADIGRKKIEKIKEFCASVCPWNVITDSW